MTKTKLVFQYTAVLLLSISRLHANVPPDVKALFVGTSKNTAYSGTYTTTDPDGGTLTYALYHSPYHGSATVSSTGSFTYTPATGYIGTDTINVRVTDSGGLNSNDLIKIMVAPSASDASATLISLNPSNKHPRLIEDAAGFTALRSTVVSDPNLVAMYAIVKADADSMLTTTPAAYSTNKDTFLQNTWVVERRMKSLALAYQITGNTSYALRARTELLAMAAYPNWHASDQFLDVGEMCEACALGYDWFYAYLSPSDRLTIRTAIVNYAFIPANDAYHGSLYGGVDLSFFVTTTDNNWSPACSGGLLMAALAIGDEETTYSGEMISYSLQTLVHTLPEMDPDGAWPEGLAYYNLAIKYFSLSFASLNMAFGTNYGLTGGTSSMSLIGNYPIRMTGGPTYYNRSDANLYSPLDISFLPWIARNYNNAGYAWYRRYSSTKSWGTPVDAYDILFYNAALYNANTPPATTDAYQAHVEQATFASTLGDPNGLYVALFGGDNGKSHGDLDTGNFIIDALGQRWAMDLGADNYNLPGYFTGGPVGQRWTYYRKRAEGQNTLVINPSYPADQNTASVSKITSFLSDATHAYAILDMTPAYAANATSVKRGIKLVNNRTQVVVQDEITTKSPTNVYWFMHTTIDASAVQLSGGLRIATLTLNGQKMQAQILSPSTASWGTTAGVPGMAAVPLGTSPNPAGQDPNTGIRKLYILMNNFSTGTVSIWLAPYHGTDPAPTNAPPVVALSAW